MIYCFYFLSFLCIVVLQTTVMPFYTLFDHFYDLFAPFIIYLAIKRSIKEAIPVIAVIGLLMDGISGGPFGIYLIVYLWMFAAIRWLIQYLHVGNIILLPLLVVGGVFFENLIFMWSGLLFEFSGAAYTSFVKTMANQLIWAGCTGPFIVLLFGWVQKNIDRLKGSLFSEKDDLGTR